MFQVLTTLLSAFIPPTSSSFLWDTRRGCKRQHRNRKRGISLDLLPLLLYSSDMFNFLQDTTSHKGSSSPQKGEGSDGTLLDLFESFALNDTTRENIALCTEMGTRMNYKELNDKATELSSHINAHISQDDRPHLIGDSLHISRLLISKLIMTS